MEENNTLDTVTVENNETQPQEQENTPVVDEKLDVPEKSASEGYSQFIPNLMEQTNFYSQNGASRYKLDEYMQATGTILPDYQGIYDSTIHDTGTSLDGKDYDKVADSKQTTPKKIFELSDCIRQIGEGIRAYSANIFDIGGEVATAVTEPWYRAFANITGEYTPPLTEEERKELNPFGEKERKEASSYAGEVTGALTQLGLGLKSTKFAFPIKPGALVDASKMQLMKIGFAELLHLGVAESVSFSEMQQNFSEFTKNFFGMTPTEFLVKNPEDSYFKKRFKNAADASGYGLMLSGAFKLGKVLYGTAPVQAVSSATTKAVEKGIGLVAKPIGKVVNPLAEKALMKVDPIGSIAKRELAEEAEKVGETVLESTAEKALKEGTKKIAKAVEEHPKTLTEKEINDVLKQATKRNMIDPEVLKNANKAVLEDAARSIVELEKMAQKNKRIVDNLIQSLESGEMSSDKFQEEIMKLFGKTGEKAAREKTALSIPGYAESLASQSEAVRSINKLIKYFGENQDRLDPMNIANALKSLDNSEKMLSFLGVVEEAVKRGRSADFVGRFTQIMQNVYLASISGRVQDAVGSLANYSLQVLDAGTAGAIGGAKQGLRNVAAKVGIAKVKTETDRVFLNEAFNMISGMYDIAKESIVDLSKRAIAKVSHKEYTGISPYMKARAQALASKQSRFGKKYGDIILVNSDAPIAQLANKVFNHGGIWASETVDDFIETLAYRGHLKRYVYHNVQVEGIKKGWTAEKIAKEQKNAYIKTIDHQFNPEDLIDFSRMGTPDGKMSAVIKRSRLAAEDTTFRSELKTPLAKWMYQTVNNDTVKTYFRLLYPFQKVGLKIAVDDYLGTRTVTTLSRPRFWKEVMAGGARQDEALAKLANGLFIQAALYDLYKEGKITGPTPANKNKAKMYHNLGWKEFSIYDENEGRYVQSGNWMGPFEQMFKTVTTILSVMDDINERVDERSGDEWTNHLLELPTAFAEASLSGAFMGQLIDNIDRGDTLGIRTFVNSMSRFGIPFVQEITDTYNQFFGEEYKQTTLTKLDSFKSKWFLGETYDELDLFGESLWADRRYGLVGPKTSRRTYDPLLEEMLNKKAYVQAPSANITEEGGKIHLDPDEVYEWQAIMGEIGTRKEMEKLIKSGTYRMAVDYDNDKYGRPSKRKLLVSKYNEMKEKAFGILVNRNTVVKSKIEDADFIKTQAIPDEQFQSYIPTM